MVRSKTRIWLINQDNCTPENGSYNREFNFAKYLSRNGYSPVLFVGSKTRHSNAEIDCKGRPYIIDKSHGFPIVYISADDSSDNKLKRILGLLKYHLYLLRTARHFASAFGEPNVVLGSSPYPFAPTIAIKISKRFNGMSICEVRDLWPLDIVVYGIARENNPLVRILYHLERWNYENADAIVMTMEGGCEYIKDKNWSKEHGGRIDLHNVYHINNGVDLEVFDVNAGQFIFEHKLLRDDGHKKVLYAGSIRLKNGVSDLIDVAECLKDDDIDFIIAGDGNERIALAENARYRGISNIHFIGSVDKKYIPSFLTQGDLLILHAQIKPEINKYGVSPNKLFDYMASGKPIISDLASKYSLVEQFDCGIERRFETPSQMADCIREMLSSQANLAKWGANSRSASQFFSFSNLTDRLIELIDERNSLK